MIKVPENFMTNEYVLVIDYYNRVDLTFDEVVEQQNKLIEILDQKKLKYSLAYDTFRVVADNLGELENFRKVLL